MEGRPASYLKHHLQEHSIDPVQRVVHHADNVLSLIHDHSAGIQGAGRHFAAEGGREVHYEGGQGDERNHPLWWAE